jgi:hypothetical protein
LVLKQLEIGRPFLEKRQIWRNTLKCFRTYVPSIQPVSEKLFLLVDGQAGRRVDVEELIARRNPFQIEGDIRGFYRTSQEILFECINHNNIQTYTDSV